MQIKQTLLRFFLILLPAVSAGQSAYLQQDDKAYILLDRMEIKSRSDSFFNYSKIRPVSRRHLALATQHYLAVNPASGLSKVDAYNARSVMINNLEWVGAGKEKTGYASRKPIGKRFYQTPASMYEVHIKDFDLVVNPVIQVYAAKENNNSQTLYLNTRGVNVRGRIANKIGFYAYITDNQEKDPLWVRNWVDLRKAVPGEGFYKPFKVGGYDYFDARGYFSFNVTKYIDVTFGYDKNFIGNGYRSLFLGEGSSPNLFLRLNTRIWKFNYQNLFMEVQSAHIPGGDRLIGKKYAAMHHLDISINKWLNIGLFEGVIFGRKDHFDFGYINPVIFYRSIEQQNGSFDNSVVGLDAKANLAKKFQVYGQFSLDEFVLSEIKKNRGWWANKFGMQIGAKYIDAFGIANLDLQFEANRVRPFTYSHSDSVANYTNYNQPLAHQLGANFKEFIGIARYQPAPKWLAVAKLIYYQQGRDSSAVSFGSNITLPNSIPPRGQDFGYSIGSGWQTNVFYASLLLSYEWKENFFLELNVVARKQDTKTPPITSANTSVVSFGLRWNMHRREFDY
ncbi:MAG: hypothetical protein IPP93_07940 [Chitinophagaceae bacterium]|nr:hypothetical protein [Chitinophagaceae bacterium]